MKDKKRNYSNADEYLKALKEEIKGIDMEALERQIDEEFSRGDFSSMDPSFPSPGFIKRMKRDEALLKKWDREEKRIQQESKKSFSKKRQSEKEVSV